MIIRKRQALSIMVSLPLLLSLGRQFRWWMVVIPTTSPAAIKAKTPTWWDQQESTTQRTASSPVPNASDATNESTVTPIAIDCRRRPSPVNKNEGGSILACLDEYSKSLARVWTLKPMQAWCSPTDDSTNSSSSQIKGLMLVKVPKSASSTMAGMVLHASHSSHHASSNHTCRVKWEHGSASAASYAHRDIRQSFLVAPVRWPISRALSDVYFHKVSLRSTQLRKSSSPNDGFLINQLRTLPDNYILQYVALQQHSTVSSSLPTNQSDASALYEQVQQVIQQYDFMVVVERLWESMAVLSHLTNTSIVDWMVQSSKTSNSWYRVGPINSGQCIQLIAPPSLESLQEQARFQQYYQSDWRIQNTGDILLYHVANRSLDMTIDVIGREYIQQQVQHAQTLYRHIQSVCANETHFPCSSNGTMQLELSRQSCYVRDFGCGYQCIRRVAQSWKQDKNSYPSL